MTDGRPSWLSGDIPYWVALEDSAQAKEEREIYAGFKTIPPDWKHVYNPRFGEMWMSPQDVELYNKHYSARPLVPWDEYVKSKIIKLWDWTGIE